jgi:hypothetical protein
MSPICACAAARNMRVRQMHSMFSGRDAISMTGQFLSTLGHKAESLGWNTDSDNAPAQCARQCRQFQAAAILFR